MKKVDLEFTICILDDEKEDIQTIKKMLNSFLKLYIKENIGVKYPKISIKEYQDQGKLQKALLNDDYIRKTLKLLILGYFLSNNDKLDEAWFAKYFPSIPTIILTMADSERIKEVTATKKYIHKDHLNNQDEFVRNLKAKLSDYWESPFWESLKKYVPKARQSWHTPGHNSGDSFKRSPFLEKDFYDKYKEFSFQSDLSVSVEELGDLSEPLETDKPMGKAMKRAAGIFGSSQTYFVTNGTSTSNKILLTTLLRPGDVVLVDRNCHKSVHQAIVMSGALPLYLSPAYNKSLGIWLPLSIEKIADVVYDKDVQEVLKPKLLILTNCTYDGIVYPLIDVVTACDPHDILVLADEAWFAYGRFHPYYAMKDDNIRYRYNALDADAHLCVQSTHKTLSAFSQASMIHVGKSLEECFRHEGRWVTKRFGNIENFHHALIEGTRYFASTSPHYPIIASLDVATTQCLNEGINILEKKLELAKKLEDHAENAVVKKEDIVGNKKGFEGYLKDPLKFSLKVKNGKMVTFKKILKEKNICWEKATKNSILFLITFGANEGQLQDLKSAIDKGKRKKCFYGQGFPPDIDDNFVAGQVEILPVDAHYAKGKYIPIKEAANSIACHMVVPYPPGIPMILPGMRISENVVADISARLGEEKEEIHGILRRDSEARIRVLSKAEEEKLSKKRPELKEKFEILKQLD